jgi:hypothetical protein
MFPFYPTPKTLSHLLTRFKTATRIQSLVRKELLARAELALASVLACHSTMNLKSIANANVRLDQYYPIARHPAHIIISRMEAAKRDLRNQEDMGTSS